MTDVLIKRELLEQVASEFEHDNDRYMLGRELRKVLDAPRQPEGEGLTRYGLGIVGGIAAFLSADDGCMVLHEDAKRAIAELRGKYLEKLETSVSLRLTVDELREELQKAYKQVNSECMDWTKEYERRKELQAERDTLRQQLAERDAAIEEWSGTAVQNGMECDRLAAQRDKLAGLLREVRVIVAREVERWTRSAVILPVNANVESGLLTRIDAALAEVK